MNEALQEIVRFDTVSVLELNLEPVSGIVQHNGSVLVTRKLQDISDMLVILPSVVRPSVCLSVCLSIHLFSCLSVYPYGWMLV